MERRIIVVVFLLFLGSIWSCNDDHSVKDVEGNNLPARGVEAVFSVKYPDASDISWEAKGVFQKAEFISHQREYKAWFNRSGVWLQTTSSLPYADVPAAVKALVEGSINYPSARWTPDETVGITERNNYPLWYSIELENGNQEVTLWVETSGNASRDAVEDYDGKEVPQPIRSFIANNYAGGYITKAIRLANGSFEVNLLDGEEVKVLVFSRSMKWENTSWPVLLSAIPAKVKAVLDAPAYTGFTVRCVSYQQYPSGDRYHFVLKQTEAVGPDMPLNVDTDGNIILQ